MANIFFNIFTSKCTDIFAPIIAPIIPTIVIGIANLYFINFCFVFIIIEAKAVGTKILDLLIEICVVHIP